MCKLDPPGSRFCRHPAAVETFVFSHQMEGLHLRSARVARGGIRWSERLADFRTEVLGLMKAQIGEERGDRAGRSEGCLRAQGPRAVKRPVTLTPRGAGRYATFVRGLLDVTDNLVDGQVVCLEDVLCHDGTDAYLVVAADKGTSSFSDLANGIAAEYDFWLGDAFASGGSSGYDHKRHGYHRTGSLGVDGGALGRDGLRR